MCIRDSAAAAASAAGDCRAFGSLEELVGSTSVEAVILAVPVSYTHLTLPTIYPV